MNSQPRLSTQPLRSATPRYGRLQICATGAMSGCARVTKHLNFKLNFKLAPSGGLFFYRVVETTPNNGYDILLIDDEPQVLLTVGELLRAKGYQVLVASDATHALRELEENKALLILLDVNLAGQDGIELMKVLRHNYPETPVVLHTGMDHDSKQIDGMLKAGAAAYLEKKDGPPGLLYAVREFIGKRD